MNVTGSLVVPTPGTVEGVVQAKVPGTFAPAAFVTDPPLKIEEANVWPLLIVEAVGAACNPGVCATTWMLPAPKKNAAALPWL